MKQRRLFNIARQSHHLGVVWVFHTVKKYEKFSYWEGGVDNQNLVICHTLSKVVSQYFLYHTKGIFKSLANNDSIKLESYILYSQFSSIFNISHDQIDW